MLTLTFFKQICDLGIYFAFAGYFAVYEGAYGPSIMAAYLLEAVAGTLTYPLRQKKGGWWILPLFLMAVPWFFPGIGWVGRIVSFPPALYIIWISAGNRYEADSDREAQIFKVFLGAVIVFFLVALLANHVDIAVEITLPVSLVGLLGDILLMRSLRHDPEVWDRPAYQATNLVAAAGVVAVSLVLSSKAFLQGCLRALQAFYQNVIYPILYVFLYLLMMIVNVFVRFFSFIASLFSFGSSNTESAEEEVAEMDLESTYLGEGGDGLAFDYIARVLGIVFAVVAIVLLFRWLSGRSLPKREKEKSDTVRTGVQEEQPKRTPRLSGTPEAQVRRTYRKFLLECRAKGVPLEENMTSLEVSHAATSYFDDEESVLALREIYMNARYHGEASKESAQEAKRLYRLVRESAETAK